MISLWAPALCMLALIGYIAWALWVDNKPRDEDEQE